MYSREVNIKLLVTSLIRMALLFKCNQPNFMHQNYILTAGLIGIDSLHYLCLWYISVRHVTDNRALEHNLAYTFSEIPLTVRMLAGRANQRA